VSHTVTTSVGPWPLTSRSNNCFLNSIFLFGPSDKYYLKNNYLTLRSRIQEGHYDTRHTTLWSCTHIPNIIDLSGKTKMLWSVVPNIYRPKSLDTFWWNSQIIFRCASIHGRAGFILTNIPLTSWCNEMIFTDKI
jgi:hypothetical protein